MKKNLPFAYAKYFALVFIITFFSFSLHAQQKKISLTGFNTDVIADPDLNATPDTLTNSTIDNGGNVFFTQGYSSGSTPENYGLPVNGILFSKVGHYFQLQPYNTNNDLEVDFYNNNSGTLTFSNADQISYDSLFILATSGGGNTFVAYTVNFTDNSSTSGNFSVSDWYCNGCSSYAVHNLSRVYQNNGVVNQAGMFAMYEYTIVLSPADRLKQVSSIDFSAPVDDLSFANIFAISGAGPSVLPVSLVYFNSSVKNGQAFLQWKTCGETNNQEYIIERTPAAAPADFAKIGTVKPLAFSCGSVYNFTNTPGLAGTYLYRLSQRDIDGNIKILGTKRITFDSHVKWLVQDLGYQWKLLSGAAFSYRLTDINGKVMRSSTSSGITLIEKPSAKGIYFIQVWQNGKVSTQKVIN